MHIDEFKIIERHVAHQKEQTGKWAYVKSKVSDVIYGYESASSSYLIRIVANPSRQIRKCTA